jgi:putative methylase
MSGRLEDLKIGSRKQLAILLSELNTFSSPNIALEQYSSDGDVAAILLWRAHMQGHLYQQNIVDLGAGTGLLGIGALLLGAKHVTFVDIDPRMKDEIQKNINLIKEEWDIDLLPESWSFILSDVKDVYTKELFSTVIMNPPFGTKKKHADKKFLQKAITLSDVVYSMHKTTTKVFLDAFARTEGLNVDWEENTSFPLKNTQQIHRKKIERIEVLLICFSK